MNYQRIQKMKEELKSIKSNFVSINRGDYNALLKITEEGTICIDSKDEVELDTTDLRDLINRCIKYYD